MKKIMPHPTILHMEGAIHIEVLQELLLITSAMKKNRMEDGTTKLTNNTIIIIEKEGTMKKGGTMKKNFTYPM